MYMTGTAIKRGILLFWALWLGLVAATNLFSLLKAAGVVGARWAFASHNFALVRSFMATYHLPLGLVKLAFAGVVLWQMAAVALFAQALATGRRKTVCTAFGVSAGLFAAFLLAGELFLRFDYEAVHMRTLTALLVSFLVVSLLPDR
jgi:hypothetical protein